MGREYPANKQFGYEFIYSRYEFGIHLVTDVFCGVLFL